MKFTNSNLAKKLIIILVVLLLFNVAYPSMVCAIDIGGILLQHIYGPLSTIYFTAEIAAGLILKIGQFDIKELDAIMTDILTFDRRIF